MFLLSLIWLNKIERLSQMIIYRQTYNCAAKPKHVQLLWVDA
jgi:hypothetical protein